MSIEVRGGRWRVPLDPPVIIASFPSRGRIAEGLAILVEEARRYSGLDMADGLK